MGAKSRYRSMRYFAVGFKGWVEVRKASVPLKTIESEDEIEVVERKRKFPSYPTNPTQSAIHAYYREIYGEPKYEEIKSRLKMKLINHKGGRVVAVLPIDRFRRFTKVSVKAGDLVALTAGTVESILRKEKRVANE